MKMLLSTNSIILKIHVLHAGVTKSIPLDMNSPIHAVCDHIRSVIREVEPENGKESKDYGLFLPHEMSKNGLWLDNTKNLAQYILKPGDTLEYRYRYRFLTIKTQNGVRKTLLVDDSWTVAELMIPICANMGILNHEEYSLIKTSEESRAPSVTKSANEKEQDKLDKMKKKLQTDDDLNWLNSSQTLRQQNIDEQEVLLVQRKYFFSDMNIDTRDPIQLGLLFIQCKEAVLNGKHPVSMMEAEQLAALQCQAELGDNTSQKNKLTKISLKECIPKDYWKSKGIEKRIVKIYSTLKGKDDVDAKREYCVLCRSLKTYGITFFLVKEKVKKKCKLVPSLLGVSRDRVLRLDEKTKEILKTWPLTSIRRWAGSFNAFTMDFGEYAPNEYYTAQTNKGEQISQLIAGYVDIIIKHHKAQEPQNLDGFEESSLAEMKIEPNKAEIVEHRSSFQNRSFEDLSREIQIAIASPIEDFSHPISGTESSQIDVTCVTSILQSTFNEATLKSDIDDFDNIKLVNVSQKNTDLLDEKDSKFVVDSKHSRLGKSVEDRELESAMSNTTSRSVQNYHLHSRNEVNSPEVVRLRNHGPDSFMTGGTRICHTIKRLNIMEQSLLKNINANLEKLNQSKHLLETKMDMNNIEHVGKEDERKNIRVLSQEHAMYDLGSMNTEVVQVLRSSKYAPINPLGIETSEENGVKHIKDIEKSFKIITVHFPSFVNNVRMISEMNSTTDDVTEIKTTDFEETSDDSPQTLIDAARKLADAFSGMLNAVKPQEEERDIDFRKSILDAANRVGEASSQLFRQITSGDKCQAAITDNCSRLGRLLQNFDHEFEDNLIYLVRSVANETAHLVQAVKTVTQTESVSNSGVGSFKLIGPVTHAGLATSQLVTCVKILAPTINQANCTNQILTEIEDVRSTIDNVSAVLAVILNNSRLGVGNPQQNGSDLEEVEKTVTNVRLALENLENHLQCGMTVVNFAPRIQSLELFLTEYDRLKTMFVITNSNGKKIYQHQEIIEVLKNFILISGKVNEEITFLCDQEQSPDDPLAVSQKTFASILIKVLELYKTASTNYSESWKDLHYETDNLMSCLLYESGTRYISYDQLIHNLYRSVQILITFCYKLLTNYHQCSLGHDLSAECEELKNRSEHILLIMNNLKFDPTNEKIVASFIRESEKLTDCCKSFCYTIHNAIPNNCPTNDTMVDIMAITASQSLAECERMMDTIVCVKPIKTHLEMVAISKMLSEQKLELLHKSFSHNNQPKLSLPQLFPIYIAILEKMRNNILQTLPKAHYSMMFEMYNSESSETSLIINLYLHLIKMNDIVESDMQSELRNKFKNVFLLMLRLIMLADNMLTSYGQFPGSHYPVVKCVDEIISTVSSLQSISGNIFDKFKANIMNKQNILRSRLSSGITKSVVHPLNSYDFYNEKSKDIIKALIENSLLCRQNQDNHKLWDFLHNLYQAYDDIANCSEYMLILSEDSRIIDDFVILSLSLLNFVVEIENYKSAPDNLVMSSTQICNKFKILTGSITKFQQTLSQVLKNYRGIFNDIIVKLQDIKKSLNDSSQVCGLIWDKKTFFEMLSENEKIKSICDELKESFDKEQHVALKTQFLGLFEIIVHLFITIYEKFRWFEERNQVINRSVDLSLNLINICLNLNKDCEFTSSLKKMRFILKDLTDNVSYLINCVREQISGYKECSSGLATVAHLSHNINEIEFSIAAENEPIKNGLRFDEESKKKAVTLLTNMANSVFNIQQSMENETVPDDKLPHHIDEFTNYLSEIVNLFIHFAKKEFLTSEVRSYVTYVNNLVENADRYLQDVKHYFDNIGMGTIIHTDVTMSGLVNQIIIFLRLFDNGLAQNILSTLELRNHTVQIPSLNATDMANTMSGMITDDDTTILFASAGIKNSDFDEYQNTLTGQLVINGEQKTVMPYKKNSQPQMSNNFKHLIHKTAEALVHDTQSLVQNSGEKQKSLAVNTESVILTISNLADEYKKEFVDESGKSSQMKMIETIENVKSALNNTYNDGSTEVSRLVLSNCLSLIKEGAASKIKPIKDVQCLEESITNFEKRLVQFTNRINNQMSTYDNEAMLDVKFDGAMEKVVNHASSVLALSSELMRMPLQKLFQNVEQSKTVATNISNQCQATLFDYLDSLEELALYVTDTKINNKLILIGTSACIQFIKLFQILQKTQQEPDNKFIKSSMLDVFYEIQNGIKTLLEFSEEVQRSLDYQLVSPRKVSFKDRSLEDISVRDVQNSNQDALVAAKEIIYQLNKLSLELVYPNQFQICYDDLIYFKTFVDLIMRFSKIAADLIGLCKHCHDHNDSVNRHISLSETMSKNKDIVDCFEKILYSLKTHIHEKHLHLQSNLEDIRSLVKEIASKSADLLTLYQRQALNPSWHQLLQTVATDLRNISIEILQFNRNHFSPAQIQNQNISGMSSYLSSSS